MKNKGLQELFFDELADMYSAENQIVAALPKLIKAASSPELKDALKSHLEETKNQVKRIEKICKILNFPVFEKECEGMKGILEEGDEMVKKQTPSPLLDATIISAAQKVEHYEIASYGTLRTFASELDLGREVVNLLQESLDEEGNANKKLTKIAEGTFFTSGVNEEAIVTASHNGKKNRK